MSVSGTHQRIVQGGLADVWKPDNADLESACAGSRCVFRSVSTRPRKRHELISQWLLFTCIPGELAKAPRAEAFLFHDLLWGHCDTPAPPEQPSTKKWEGRKRGRSQATMVTKNFSSACTATRARHPADKGVPSLRRPQDHRRRKRPCSTRQRVGATHGRPTASEWDRTLGAACAACGTARV